MTRPRRSADQRVSASQQSGRVRNGKKKDMRGSKTDNLATRLPACRNGLTRSAGTRLLYGVRPRAAAMCEESHGNQNGAEVSRLFFIFVLTSKLSEKEAGVYFNFIFFHFQQNRQLSFFIN